jgi:hypothetical protein
VIPVYIEKNAARSSPNQRLMRTLNGDETAVFGERTN